MPIKWKNSKVFNPQELLNRLSEIREVDATGNVFYSNFEYHDIYESLFSMLDFPATVSGEINLDLLVISAFKEVQGEEVIKKDVFISSLNNAANAQLSTKEKPFSMLTSFSINSHVPFKNRVIGSSRIRIVSEYPRKYNSRKQALDRHRKGLVLEQKGYKKIIITNKAKSPYGAAHKALNSIDIVRGILSLFSNFSMEIVGDAHAPINRVRLGQVHTLHKNSGMLAMKDTIWFEPNFQLAEPFSHPHPDALKKNFHSVLKNLDKCLYNKKIEEALVRYVRALDEKDNNVAAIRLWGALEELSCSDSAKYDNIVKQCAFLFKEAKYHRQILEHLKEFRNQNIHSGDQSRKAKTYCYQMQFYFIRLVLFHLNNAGEFNSLKEAQEFLELPIEKETLLLKKKKIDKALKFREIE